MEREGRQQTTEVVESEECERCVKCLVGRLGKWWERYKIRSILGDEIMKGYV